MFGRDSSISATLSATAAGRDHPQSHPCSCPHHRNSTGAAPWIKLNRWSTFEKSCFETTEGRIIRGTAQFFGSIFICQLVASFASIDCSLDLFVRWENFNESIVYYGLSTSPSSEEQRDFHRFMATTCTKISTKDWGVWYGVISDWHQEIENNWNFISATFSRNLMVTFAF